jgi:Tol biopolymer transport system component
MTISAPPRPPGPSDPVDGDEFDALVKALIKEARQRARRRRFAFASVASVVALAGLSVFALVDRTARSQGSSPGRFAKAGAPGGATRSRIAFVSFPGRRPAGEAAQAFEIIVINANGSGKHTVVHWRGKRPPFGIGPSWSPDGRRLVFDARSKGSGALCRSEGPCNDELYSVNADGSGLRRLTRNAAADGQAAWSPDGRKIAFISRRDGGAAEIYVMNADGTDQRRLTRTHGDEGDLAWSPDGTKIAFTGTGVEKLRDVYVINADGTHQRQLTAAATAEEWDPLWSPDGRQIAYLQKSQLDYDPISRIYVMNADGSGGHLLSNVRAVGTAPSWSPDGRKLVFTGPRGLYVAAADGTGVHRVAKSVFPDAFPVWSPDGRKIAFLGGLRPFQSPSLPPPADLYVINADGGGRLNLTRTPEVDDGWAQAWAPG